MVIALGDSFHDSDAHNRLSTADRAAIVAMQARRDWIWISGNHDPALPSDLGGVVAIKWRSARSCFVMSLPGHQAKSPAICIPRLLSPRVDVDGAAMFRLRWRARGDAGFRRLYRRPEYS